MVEFMDPEAFAPETVVILIQGSPQHAVLSSGEDELILPVPGPQAVLRAIPSGDPLTFPLRGVWRSFAESEPGNLNQIERIAWRFGGLTEPAATDGEPVIIWSGLIESLRLLSVCWTETGELSDRVSVSEARFRAHAVQNTVLAKHQPNGGQWAARDGQWVIRCLDMEAWWRLSAVRDVLIGAPMRRCRHCGLWFSLHGLRADAGFCSPAHRSAFHQGRKPASTFWAEVA